MNTRTQRNVDLPTAEAQTFIRVKTERSLCDLGTHWHMSGQLICMETGLGIMDIDGVPWILMPGRVGWIPPRTKHSVRTIRKVTGWLLYIEPEVCELFPKMPRLFVPSPLLDQLVARIAEWQSDAPPLAVRRRLLSVIGDEIEATQRKAFHLRMPTDPRLQRIVEKLIRNPASDDGLESLARQGGMSHRSLMRNFKRDTGLTYGQWRQKLRVLASIQLLVQGKSVIDTSLSCGYANVSAFIRLFKRDLGMTPAAYQRDLISSNQTVSQRTQKTPKI
jgi:AraC-like DNA-binding protein